MALNAQQLDAEVLENTMSVLLKHETDLNKVRRRMNVSQRGVDVDDDDMQAFRWRE